MPIRFHWGFWAPAGAVPPAGAGIGGRLGGSAGSGRVRVEAHHALGECAGGRRKKPPENMWPCAAGHASLSRAPANNSHREMSVFTSLFVCVCLFSLHAERRQDPERFCRPMPLDHGPNAWGL